MKTLLWKDYRLNRLLLIFGSVVCVGPWAIAITRHYQLLHRGGNDWWGPEPWVSTAGITLGLCLITIAMLGGTAVAAERADRSAEFLAYLPVSRWKILAAKSCVALTAMAAIWLVNLGFLLLVAPRIAEDVYAVEIVRRSEVRELFIILGPLSILLFGAGWFWSVVLRSHGLATGMSVFTLAVIVMGTIGIEHGLGVEGFLTNQTLATLFLAVGIGGYIAGCLTYLYRMEP